MIQATYTIKGKRHTAEIVKSNHKTVWVKAPDGRIVKRHGIKHDVIIKEAANGT